jgi:hypothetical protein
LVTPNTACQNDFSTESVRNRRDVNDGPFELARGAQCDDTKLIQPYDQTLNFLSQTIAEILGVGIVAGIGKWQHRYRAS